MRNVDYKFFFKISAVDTDKPLMFHISKKIVVKVLEWRPPEGIWLSFKVSSGMSLFIKISSTPFLSNL